MGKRLTKIVTRTGDDGTTGLGDGTRVRKDAARIHALGAIDTLNSAIGRVLAHELPGAVRDCLDRIQHDLFDLGGELSLPGVSRVDESYLARLEREIEAFNAQLAPLKEFILPGGTLAAADAHLARTSCREAERAVVALGAGEAVSDAVRRYLNRLSDLLFVIARVVNRAQGRGDVLWQPGKNRG